jgi:hypothetical protein
MRVGVINALMIPTSSKPNHPVYLGKIKTWARAIRIGCILAIAIQSLEILFLASGFFIPEKYLNQPSMMSDWPGMSAHAVHICIILGVSIAIPGVLLSCKGLYHLMRLVDLYGGGTFFATEVVRQYQKIGWVYLGFSGLGFIAQFIEFIIKHMDAFRHLPGGQLYQVAPIQDVAFGGMLIVLSWIMDEGRRMREEQELTV